jgi:large subunit ribosomal protein L14e
MKRELPKLGSVVEVMRGRDTGLYFVVIAHAQERFVYLADGDVRRVEQPKRKNVLHVRNTGYLGMDTDSLLRSGQRLTNAVLRYDMRRFHAAYGREGDSDHGER